MFIKNYIIYDFARQYIYVRFLKILFFFIDHILHQSNLNFFFNLSYFLVYRVLIYKIFIVFPQTFESGFYSCS